MYVEFGKTRGREGGGRWEVDSKGIASRQSILSPSYISPYLFLLSLPLSGLSAPERSSQRPKVPHVSLFLRPRHPTVEQKNNLSPSSLVSSRLRPPPPLQRVEKGNEIDKVGKGR